MYGNLWKTSSLRKISGKDFNWIESQGKQDSVRGGPLVKSLLLYNIITVQNIHKQTNNST